MTDPDTKPVTKTAVSAILEDEKLAKAFVTWTHTAWDAKAQEEPRPDTLAWWQRVRERMDRAQKARQE